MIDRRNIALSGDIDCNAVPKVCRVLDEIDDTAIIDLSGVQLLTSVGLSELARVAERVGHRRVTLAGASPHVRRVLESARFDVLFKIDRLKSSRRRPPRR